MPAHYCQFVSSLFFSFPSVFRTFVLRNREYRLQTDADVYGRGMFLAYRFPCLSTFSFSLFFSIVQIATVGSKFL
jgi:hypothetical protein